MNLMFGPTSNDNKNNYGNSNVGNGNCIRLTADGAHALKTVGSPLVGLGSKCHWCSVPMGLPM